MMHVLNNALRFAAIGLLAPSFVWAVSVNSCSAVGSSTDSMESASERASEIFEEVAYHNAAVATASDHLAAIGAFPSDVSWKAHATRLTTAKENVNAISGLYCELEGLKPEVEPWQARLIDEIRQGAVTGVVHVEAAIDLLNENPARIEATGQPAYHAQVAAVYDNAKLLEEKLDAYTMLADARQRVSEIESN